MSSPPKSQKEDPGPSHSRHAICIIATEYFLSSKDFLFLLLTYSLIYEKVRVENRLYHLHFNLCIQPLEVLSVFLRNLQIIFPLGSAGCALGFAEAAIRPGFLDATSGRRWGLYARMCWEGADCLGLYNEREIIIKKNLKPSVHSRKELSSPIIYSA